MTRPVIAWFRRNLRLADNAAWTAACDSGRPVIAVYVSDTLDSGGASRWWLHHSLSALERDLANSGVGLTVRSGDPDAILPDLVRSTGAVAVFCCRRFEPEARRQETSLRDRLTDDVELQMFNDGVLLHPNIVKTGSGTPYRIFTPFYRASLAVGEPDVPTPAPEQVFSWKAEIAGMSVNELKLLPTKPDWSAGLQATWQPGEASAHQRLAGFESRVPDYTRDRDLPGLEGTSRLSPHLHFGELSPRQVWHAMRISGDSASPFLRQLYWREFSQYLLYHFPTLPDDPLRTAFAAFPWSNDPSLLSAWQRGETGIPIIDSGMRQLWQTGWMHNRVRMLTASFLVKNLLIPWQAGRAWFDDTLVDADMGNNAAGWQWVAGCGTDSAPYFRIFNPVTQGQKFDPNGDYVRRWVPELGTLPNKLIHDPWAADPEVLADCGVTLGDNYPNPIVDLGESRKRALEAFATIRS